MAYVSSQPKNHPKRKILFAVWELEPFLKVGGLGEVARSLPRALKAKEIDIRIVIPNYRALKTFGQRKKLLGSFMMQYGKQKLQTTVHKISFLTAEIPIYLIGNEYMDKPISETFVVFSLAVTELIRNEIIKSWVPDIIHCNDNHCGFIPLLVKERKIPVKTLFTIHCISHQRRYPVTIADKLRISQQSLSPTLWETKTHQINSVQEAIVNADWVNTVSPTYLNEIQTEEHGAGLDEVMRQYRYKSSAILNGIDYTLKNPATNTFLSARFSVSKTETILDSQLLVPEKGKEMNKTALQQRLELPQQKNQTIISYIGRLDPRQKGIDLILRMIARDSLQNVQYVVMGQGEESWEERFLTLSAFNPDKLSMISKYDDALASQIYAASDFTMIPSYFEPCCLIQMNAMRYGALPVCRATGGLNDTVKDGVNGYIFEKPTSVALEAALVRAIDIKLNNPKRHERMVQNAMRTNFSWLDSAKQYVELYENILSA